METKVCSKCGIEKTIEHFIPCKGGKFGVRGECKECKKEYDRIHNNLNKKQNAIRGQKYRTLHKDTIAKSKLRWQRTHKKSYQKSNSNYIKTDKGRASLVRRRCIRETIGLGIENTLTAEQFKKIIQLQNNRCIECNKPFTSKRKPTRDHIIPLSKGGGLTFENTQALCRECNSRKRDKMDYNRIQVWVGIPC